MSLLLILIAAWLLGSLFSRYGLPVMLGELLAGVVLGPPLLGIVSLKPSIELIADFGIFFVMFYTRMELNPRELLEHLWPSLFVALGGFILPFVLAYFAARGFGGDRITIFIYWNGRLHNCYCCSICNPSFPEDT